MAVCFYGHDSCFQRALTGGTSLFGRGWSLWWLNVMEEGVVQFWNVSTLDSWRIPSLYVHCQGIVLATVFDNLLSGVFVGAAWCILDAI